MNAWMKTGLHTGLKNKVFPKASKTSKQRSPKRHPAGLSFFEKEEVLDDETLDSICLLLGGGFSFQETLKILQTDANQKIFSAITEELSEGKAVDSFISGYCGKQIRVYLSGFLSYMNLRDALSASLNIIRQEKHEKSVLIKGCLYPCLLLGGMFAGIFLFASFVLPVMLGLMDSLHIDSALDYALMAGIIRTGSMIMAILTTAGGICVWVMLQQKRIRKTYLMMAAKFPDSLLVKTATRDFTRFFLECCRRKLSTYEALHILSALQEKPLVSLIAGMLDQSLLRGDTLEEAMRSCPLEKALVRFIHIAASAKDCTSMLEGYLAMCEKRTNAAIRRFSRTVQLTSYILIGLMLVFVYSVLMLPMSMLSQI